MSVAASAAEKAAARPGRTRVFLRLRMGPVRYTLLAVANDAGG